MALGPALSSPSFEALDVFLHAEAREARVFPPRHEIFRALELTPLKEVKAVILGQDPYPTEGNANGLGVHCRVVANLPTAIIRWLAPGGCSGSPLSSSSP